MVRKGLLLLAASLCLTFVPVSCEEPAPVPGPDEQEQPQEEVKLEALKGEFTVIGDMIFEDSPKFTLKVLNPNKVDVTVAVKMTIATDKGESVQSWTDSVEVAASGEKLVDLVVQADLAPGFYNGKCFVNGKNQKNFSFGIRPFEIVSAPDMQPDFDQFWADAKSQLPALIEGETVNLIEIKSTDTHKIYCVEMQSVPNDPDGDPVIVRGFFVEPQDGKKHPVLMHFFGWDDRGGSVTVPSGANGEYTEFYLSTRGQYHNNRAAGYEKQEAWIAEHGEWYAADPCRYASILKPTDEYNWFGFNFGDKNSFYYRGAFMDCVQAVRFMATRETSDMNNLFAEGSSQGGALSYACAALSDYQFNAIAPNVAFLGDYPDYFQIVSWPANVATSNRGTMTDEEMYAFLSYFDTKNLATRISCAVHASSGLKDGTCPPHTNFAPFNNLDTEDKVMIVDPEMGHSFPAGWESKWKEFFIARMK